MTRLYFTTLAIALLAGSAWLQHQVRETRADKVTSLARFLGVILLKLLTFALVSCSSAGRSTGFAAQLGPGHQYLQLAGRG